MLALSDQGLAYLVLAAGRVSPRKRSRWLRELAVKLDPPTIATPTVVSPAHVRTLAARRKATERARRKNGLHVYRLELSDHAVEGMPVRPRTVSGRLISLGHRPSTAGTTPCPSPAAIATAPTPIAAARSSCEQRAHGAAIAHGRQLRRAYDEIIEKDQIHSIRDSDDDFERIDLHAESENPLFFYKRAHTLWRLLDAKRAFQESECCSAKYGNALDQLLKHPRGERALSIALQEIRKAGLSSQVADLSVCGAVAPYNVLLGGKLVALLMASAETLSLYRDRYSGKPSIISSKMVTSC
jgi:hypothetical protein